MTEPRRELPPGWEWRTIRDVTMDVPNVDPRREPTASFTYVDISSIDNERLAVTEARRLTGREAPSRARRPVRTGDVVFSNVRTYLRNIARINGLPEPAIASTGFTVLRPGDDVIPDYLFRYVASDEFIEAITPRQTGTQYPATSDRVVRSQPIPLPPIDEQRRIAAWLAAIDGRRASIGDRLAAARAIVDRLRTAILAAACSGRLTADWRAGHNLSPVDPGPALSVQAARHSSGADNTPELTEIPASWAWWSVESITSKVIDYRGRTPPTSSEGTIPHVRTTQIREGRIDWHVDRFVTEETYDRYMTRGMPRRGDVLFTMEAPLGEVGVIDTGERFSIAQRILLLSPVDDVIGDFLALALRSPAVRRAIELRSTGTGVSGIAYKRLRSVLIPRPPAEEQLEIVERAKAALETADRLSAGIAAAEVALERSARGALARAFRGEVVPPDVDSDLV